MSKASLAAEHMEPMGNVPNNSMQLTALRAAELGARYTTDEWVHQR